MDPAIIRVNDKAFDFNSHCINEYRSLFTEKYANNRKKLIRGLIELKTIEKEILNNKRVDFVHNTMVKLDNWIEKYDLPPCDYGNIENRRVKRDMEKNLFKYS